MKRFTGLRIIVKNGKRLYENEHGYIHCQHNVPLIPVTYSFGNQAFICSSCGEVVRKEYVPTD